LANIDDFPNDRFHQQRLFADYSLEIGQWPTERFDSTLRMNGRFAPEAVISIDG
jgi:hypothetical protein